MSIRIIYTPDVERLIWINENPYVFPDVTESENYKKMHSKLLSNQPEIPETLGVVTLQPFPKSISRARRHDLGSILENARTILCRDYEDHLSAEHAVRSLDVIMNRLILLYSVKREGEIMPFALTANIPHYRLVIKKSIEDFVHIREKISTIKDFKDYPKAVAVTDDITRTLIDLQESFKGPTFIDTLIKKEQKRIERHRISPEFPLHDYRSGTLDGKPALLYLTSKFVENVEYPESIKKNLLFETNRDYFKRFEFNTFAIAEKRESFEEMFDSLPSPKTILTDIYILDHLPQLSENFEAVEFSPNNRK